MLVDQRMAIRLMRLDGDGRRAQYIQVYLSISSEKKERIRKKKSFPDD